MAPSPKKATATRPWRLRRERRAGGRGDAAADDPEAADEAVLEVDDVHRAGAPAADAGRAAEHLGGQRLGLGALGERVAVAAVGAADVVVGLERHADADRDRLLAGGEVRGAVDLAPQEEAVDRLLELADQQHPPVGVEVGASRLALAGGRRAAARLGARVGALIGSAPRRRAACGELVEPVGDRPSSGSSSSPEARACSSSSAAKSSSVQPLPISAWTISRAAAATGIGTSSSRAASKPRSKSLRSSTGVKVGVKSSFT